MGEEEERVRKLDEQSVRRPASQSQLFNPRQGSLDWASGRADEQEIGPTVITKHSDTIMHVLCLCFVYFKKLAHFPGTSQHSSPAVFTREEVETFFNLFHFLPWKVFSFSKKEERRN